MPDRSKAPEAAHSKRAADFVVPKLLIDIVRQNRQTPMAVIRNMVIYEANEALARMLGAGSAEELRGLDFSGVLTPESRAAARERFERRARGELLSDAHVYEATMLDGRRANLEVSAISWPSDPAMTLSVMRDITERERSLEELKESEELYRTVAETMPAGVVMWDSQGRYVYINDEAARIAGCTKEEYARNGPPIHPDDEETCRIRERVRTADGTAGAYETRLARKDGSVVWVSGHWRPILGDDEKPGGTCGVFLDITERKRADEALRHAEERYRLLAENASDVLWQADRELRFTYVSQAIKRFGYEPDDWIGHRLGEFLPPEEQTLLEQKREEYSANPGARRYEMRMCRKDGSLVWTEIALVPITDPGSSATLQGVTRDVTERKRAEERLLQAHENLERAHKLQTEFLNSVTHEVRTPLTAVNGYVSMLMEGIAGPVSEAQKELLVRVQKSSDNLMAIVDNLLEIARLKSGRVDLRPTACMPARIAKHAAVSVRPQGLAKGVTVNVVSHLKDETGIYDAGKLSMILTNLLANAVKFTDHGQIEVTLEGDRSGIEVIIVDPGAGIAESDLSTVFDEFRQLDHPRRHKPAGFGLGLAIVASMVEAIGATLTVSSAKGVGTAFTLYVPALDA